MSEFKEMEVQEDYNEKITTIATKMAISQYNVMKGKNVNLDFKIAENIGSVKNKISQIYEEIEKKSLGITLPSNLNDTIAEYLLRTIKPGEFKIEEIGNIDIISTQILHKEILVDQEKKHIYDEKKAQQTVSQNMLNSDTSIEEIGKIIESYKLNDGTEIVFLDPLDERFRIPVGESLDIEKEILEEEIRLSKVDEDFAFGNINLETAINRYKEDMNGLKLDARLRKEYERLEAFGAIELVRNDNANNEYNREKLKLLLDAIRPEKAQENGFVNDSYTMSMKLAIYSRIMNDPIMQENGEYQNEILSTLKEADPELYALLEREPKILEIMQTISKCKNPSDAAIIIFGDSEPRSADEFLETMEKLAIKNRNIPINPDVTKGFGKYKKEYIEDLREKARQEERNKEKERIERMKNAPYEERVKYKKEQIIRNIEKTGIGPAIMATFSFNMIDRDSGEVLDIMGELLDFDEVGQDGNYASQISSKEIELMRRRLDSLLEHQTEERKPYIMFLGNVINRASELEKSKVISAENVDVKGVIENISSEDVELFGKLNKEDDGAR